MQKIIMFLISSIFLLGLGFAANPSVIVVDKGESRSISFPAKLKSIDFNKESGFTIRTLEGGVWRDVDNKLEEFQPLQGVIVRNFTEPKLRIEVKYANITKTENTLFQRNLQKGWNLIGIAQSNDQGFYGEIDILQAIGESLPISMLVDITKNMFNTNDTITNLLSNSKKVLSKSQLNNKNIYEGSAYVAFLNQNSMIGGTQEKSENEENGKLLLSESQELSGSEAKLSEITRIDNYNNGDQIVAGVNNYKLGEFSLDSNDIKPLKINNIDLILTGETSSGYNYITNIKIKSDGSILSTGLLNSPSSFNNLNLEIGTGETKNLQIYADISKDYNTNNDLQLELSINDVDQINQDNSVSDLDINKKINTVLFDIINGAKLITKKLSDDTPSVDTISVGSDSVEIAKFDFKAEDDDITIQQLAFTGTEGAHDLGAQFAIYKDGQRISEYEPLINTGNKIFTHFETISGNFQKDNNETLIVKMKNNLNINNADKTNKTINLTMITGGIFHAQTKLVSKSNSKEVELSKVLGPSFSQYVRRTMINVGNFTADKSSASAELSTNNGKSAAVKVLPFQFNIDNISDISDKDIKVDIDKVELAGNEKNNVEIGITTGDTLSGVTLTKISDNPSFDYAIGDFDDMNVYVVFTGDAGNDISAEGTTIKLSYNIDNEDNDDSVKVKIPQLSDSLSNKITFDKYAINTSDFAEFLSGVNSGTGVNTSDNGYGMVWSDKAASSLTGGVYDWFMDKKVNGLDTNYVEIY